MYYVLDKSTLYLGKQSEKEDFKLNDEVNIIQEIKSESDSAVICIVKAKEITDKGALIFVALTRLC